jgi:hypothetical protein
VFIRVHLWLILFGVRHPSQEQDAARFHVADEEHEEKVGIPSYPSVTLLIQPQRSLITANGEGLSMPRLLGPGSLPSQELRHFTNRDHERCVVGRILALPSGQPLPVVMFYGVGGTGKSWLLRRLRADQPPEIPAALLDFDPQSGGFPYRAGAAGEFSSWIPSQGKKREKGQEPF